MAEDQGFQPRMMDLRGRAYMQVADRVVWLSEVTKAALNGATGYEISTEMVEANERIAIFRATVRIMGAGGEVIRQTTGTGSETPGDFGDYIEKAETKAIGRALGFAGFGTAAGQEENGLIVDAPREMQQGRQQQAPRPQGQQGQAEVERVPGGATMRQIRFISSLMTEKGLNQDQGRELVYQVANVESMRDLSSQMASAVVERLQAMPSAQG